MDYPTVDHIFPTRPKEGDIFFKLGEILLPYSGKWIISIIAGYYYHDGKWIRLSNGSETDG